MSPEILAHATEEYVSSLQIQVNVAKAFFFGRVEEGIEGLLQLPESIRVKIDQLIWDAAGGEPIDPTEKDGAQLIAGAIIHSVEERMGIGD
jgi:hypothetical protein